MIARFEYVQFRLPEPAALYLAVKTVLPGVSPLRTEFADARCNADPARITAFESTAATVFAPVEAYDIKHDVELAFPNTSVVTETSTLPEAGTVSVTEGPTVVRSPYVVKVLDSAVAIVLPTVPAVPGGP